MPEAQDGAVNVVLVSAPDVETAERLVRTLVDEQLAACGNIIPGITSIYRWQGVVQRESEVLVLLKAPAAKLARLTERVPQLHPYEVPEVLVLEVAGGHSPYLDWVREAGGL
jgi:periplasmic divalent cation tolerance protein